MPPIQPLKLLDQQRAQSLQCNPAKRPPLGLERQKLMAEHKQVEDDHPHPPPHHPTPILTLTLTPTPTPTLALTLALTRTHTRTLTLTHTLIVSKARNHENLVIEAPARSRPVAVASYAPPYPRYQELELPGAQGHLEIRAGGLWRVCSVAPPPGRELPGRVEAGRVRAACGPLKRLTHPYAGACLGGAGLDPSP